MAAAGRSSSKTRPRTQSSPPRDRKSEAACPARLARPRRHPRRIRYGCSPACRGKGEGEARAALRLRLVADRPTKRFEDGSANPEAKAEAAGLGRDEGLEKAFPYLSGHAISEIRHREDYASFPDAGRNRDLPSLARELAHRLYRVAHEIERHLLDQQLVAAHQRQVGSRIERQ